MKRELEDHGAPPSSARQKVDTFEVVSEYLPMTEGNYDFRVCCAAPQGGKCMRSSRNMKESEDILVESPLVCWPLNCSADWASVRFCEHCLRVLPVEQNAEYYHWTPSSATDVEGEVATPLGSFCSQLCADTAVLGSSTSNVSDKSPNGWYSVIGGKVGLQRLRELDWREHPRGHSRVFRSSTPVPLEAVARVIASITSRFSVVAALFPQMAPEEVLHIAARPFERLVTPGAYTEEFNSVQAHEALSSLLFVPVSQSTGSAIATVLLSPDSLTQIWGQLVLNSQQVRVWGTDKRKELCVLEGAGVYTLQSCINHSCNPNCGVSCGNDATITVHTLRQILPDEELTIAYIPTTLDVTERRRLLAEGYLFWCECARCQLETCVF